MLIEYFDKMAFTPALPLAVKGWNELIELGLCQNNFIIQWDQQAIVAYDRLSPSDEKVVPAGVLVWTKFEWQKEAFINLGYVLNTFRGRGLYTQMWKALVYKARQEKLDHIAGSSSLDNSILRMVARNHGRKEVGVTLWYSLNDPLDRRAFDAYDEIFRPSRKRGFED